MCREKERPTGVEWAEGRAFATEQTSVSNSIALSALPSWLRNDGLFCCWKYKVVNDRLTKVPYNPRTGRKGDASDPNAFTSLDEAAKVSANFDGMGVGVFGDVTGIDLDHVLNADGTFKDDARGNLARDVLDIMDGAYAEFSPGGDGLHILFRSSISERFHGSAAEYKRAYYFNRSAKLGIEVYPAGMTNKYVTVTGRVYRPEFVTSDRREELQTVLDKYMRRKPKATTSLARRSRLAMPSMLEDTDQSIIEAAGNAKNGAKFSRLFSGDWQSDYNSQSEADQGLCCILAFWTGGDADRIDRLFRQSGLYRDKWERDDYRTATINNAIELCSESYSSEVPTSGAYDDPETHKQDRQTIAPDPKRQTVLKLLNAMRADTLLGKSVAYDEFSNARVALSPLPWDDKGDYPRRWGNTDDVALFAYVQNARPRATRQDVADAVTILSCESSFDPLHDMLMGESDDLPKWDGKPRVETMLIDLLGCEDTPYTRVAWATFMCGAFMRGVRPGAKFDYMAVLFGPQGIGKSTFCKLLAIRPEWYLSGPHDLSDVANTARELAGRFIAEQEELAGFGKRDVETLKAAITRTHDVYIEKYQTTQTERPRRSVFIGTTNSRQVLRDATGNRRYLIFECGVRRPAIDLFSDEAREYIMQAWAELSHRYRDGGCTPFRGFLPRAQERDAERVRQAFTEVDTVADAVTSWVAEYAGNKVCVVQVAVEALKIDRAVVSRDKQLMRRITDTLDHRCHGWRRGNPNRQRVPEYGVQTCWVRSDA